MPPRARTVAANIHINLISPGPGVPGKHFLSLTVWEYFFITTNVNILFKTDQVLSIIMARLFAQNYGGPLRSSREFFLYHVRT